MYVWLSVNAARITHSHCVECGVTRWTQSRRNYDERAAQRRSNNSALPRALGQVKLIGYQRMRVSLREREKTAQCTALPNGARERCSTPRNYPHRFKSGKCDECAPLSSV
jgi:hypothetical protein